MDDMDVRLQPGAYISDNVNLYEVLRPVGEEYLELCNCRKDRTVTYGVHYVCARFHLVKAAPVAPDYIEEALAA